MDWTMTWDLKTHGNDCERDEDRRVRLKVHRTTKIEVFSLLELKICMYLAIVMSGFVSRRAYRESASPLEKYKTPQQDDTHWVPFTKSTESTLCVACKAHSYRGLLQYILRNKLAWRYQVSVCLNVWLYVYTSMWTRDTPYTIVSVTSRTWCACTRFVVPCFSAKNTGELWSPHKCI